MTNVELLKGQIEHIPLPDASVVLKPGGCFAVSDVIVRGDVPAAVRRRMELWVGCVAGALEESEFMKLLLDSGFESPGIEPTRLNKSDDARVFLTAAGAKEGPRPIPTRRRT